MDYRDDFLKLLDLFTKLVDSQSDLAIEPGDEWLNDAQALSLKLFQHLSSVQVLVNGTTVVGKNKPNLFFVDHTSIGLLVRAALEGYLVFFYLFGGPDRRLAKFRHSTWTLGGLSDRQKYHFSTDAQKEQVAREAEQMEKLRVEIQAAPEIQAYSEKQKRQLLAGKWRIDRDWANLARDAGFHAKYFDMVYSHLCGYAHSSYISALQVRDAWQSRDDQRMLSDPIVGVCVVIMAHFAFTYSELFGAAKSLLESLPEAQAIANKWRIRAEDLVNHYGG